jgi:hypothetical protein
MTSGRKSHILGVRSGKGRHDRSSGFRRLGEFEVEFVRQEKKGLLLVFRMNP